MFAYRHHSITTKGATIHFSQTGAGTPVLFVQGVGVEGRGFGPQIETLAHTHTCVCIDNRGIGKSHVADPKTISVVTMANDVLAVADNLGFERFHLVGHSLGGVIAQRVALNAPNRVLSVVFQCTFAGGKDLVIPSLRLMWLGMRSQMGSTAMRRSAFAQLVSPPQLTDAAQLQATIAQLEEAFGRNLGQPPAIASVQLRALRDHDERDRLRELAHIPCLVQSATYDPIARPQFGRELAARIGTAEFEQWEHASHALPIQQRDDINAKLLIHFARSDATQQ